MDEKLIDAAATIAAALLRIRHAESGKTSGSAEVSEAFIAAYQGLQAAERKLQPPRSASVSGLHM